MRKRRLHPPHQIGKVNVTPMIDVVMCLIIFYLLVGKLATTQRAKDLPESGAGSADRSTAAVVVDILPAQAQDEAANLTIDGVSGDIQSLESILKLRAGASAATRPEVHVRAGRDLPYSQLAPVLVACRRAGLTSVRLVAERRP